MIVERPAVDWLTLTTYNMREALETDALIHSMVGDKPTKERIIRKYEGREGDGFFIGEGEQTGSKHFMVNLWGELADGFMFLPLRPVMACTRIDLQLTLPLPDENPFTRFYESIPVLAQNERERGQRARGLKPIPDPDGWCTQYVGSKSSQRFYRIYVKGEEGDLYIRFEVVYKGKKDLAGKVFERVTQRPANMTTYIAGEVDTLPAEAGIVKPFVDFLRPIRGKALPQGRTRPTDDKTLRWLVKQVMPAFTRVLGNEDTRFTASVILRDLYEFWERLDNG